MSKSYDKIKAERPAKSIKPISTQIPEDPPHFSFKYLEINHRKFKYDRMKINYFKKLLERLKEYCNTSIYNLKQGGINYKCHPINWNECTESNFNVDLDEELLNVEPYQIKVTDSFGRIHGIFVGNLFFIIWLDPEHKLYKRKK